MAGLERCSHCKNTGHHKRCTGCSSVVYCSVACQKANWGMHKPVCVAVRTLAAGGGSAEDHYAFGHRFCRGDGVVKSVEKALFHFTKAAESGHMDARVALGRCYRVEKNHKAALHWFSGAAVAGYPRAMIFTAQCYAYGIGVDASAEAALEWYLKAAETGDPFTLLSLFFVFLRGRGVPKDAAYAVSCLKKVSNRDLWSRSFPVEFATFHLGLCHERGLGVERDMTAAYACFENAAQTYSPASVRLGFCFELGRGVARDLRKAAQTFTDAKAYHHLALVGLRDDLLLRTTLSESLGGVLGTCAHCRTAPGSKRCKWCPDVAYCSVACMRASKQAHKAACMHLRCTIEIAESGGPGAQFELGRRYAAGIGVGRDPARAMHLFLAAATAGLPSAMLAVSLCYKNGRGCEIDARMATLWLDRASHTYHSLKAEFALGRCCELGVGCEVDVPTADDYYASAARVLYGPVARHAEARLLALRAREVSDAPGAGIVGTEAQSSPSPKCVHCNGSIALEDHTHRDPCRRCGGLLCSRRSCDRFPQQRTLCEAECLRVLARRADGEGGAGINADAAFELARRLAHSHWAVRDNLAAVRWYRKAASVGHSAALFHLGICYDKGWGVERDAVAAAALFRSAAEAGNAKAQARLGICYERGQGVAVDLAAAERWYRAAGASARLVALFARQALRGGGGAGVSRSPDRLPSGSSSPSAVDLSGAPCAAPGCPRPGAFVCGRCSATCYCSAACQRAHRRAHKSECRSASWAGAAAAST